jgi:hypothetical protein
MSGLSEFQKNMKRGNSVRSALEAIDLHLEYDAISGEHSVFKDDSDSEIKRVFIGRIDMKELPIEPDLEDVLGTNPFIREYAAQWHENKMSIKGGEGVSLDL